MGCWAVTSLLRISVNALVWTLTDCGRHVVDLPNLGAFAAEDFRSFRGFLQSGYRALFGTLVAPSTLTLTAGFVAWLTHLSRWSILKPLAGSALALAVAESCNRERAWLLYPSDAADA